METILNLIDKNALIVSFLWLSIILLIAELFTKYFLKSKVPSSAIAILLGLVLAYFGGVISGGEKGISDIKIFKGIGVLGGSMFRDYAIVASALGVSIAILKKSGKIGLISLLIGIIFFFSFGVLIAWLWGIRDAESLATIGAGACTYIVGPITGAAVGASSDIIALSIATGVVKAITITILTPIMAKKIGLNSPESALVFGGLVGTNSGVAAGLAATDPKLVPYGTFTATFYTGLGCLLCPSVLYITLKLII
jgi:malonate transporter MadM subunit